jgi:hypothetical protein
MDCENTPGVMTELERICREEWEKLPKYRCAKLVASNPRRVEAVITAKGASTKYRVKGLNTYVNVIFMFLICYTFAKKKRKKMFALSLWGILCRLMREIRVLNTFRIHCISVADRQKSLRKRSVRVIMVLKTFWLTI